MSLSITEVGAGSVAGAVAARASVPVEEAAPTNTTNGANLVEITRNESEPSSTGFTRQEVQELVDSMFEMADILHTKLDFSVQEETNEIVVKVIDKDTDEIVKQIPPEELLKLQLRMKELTGILLDENA